MPSISIREPDRRTWTQESGRLSVGDPVSNAVPLQFRFGSRCGDTAMYGPFRPYNAVEVVTSP